MQIYCVGGAVRDGLLRLAVSDRDYVVVGATPEQMHALGFTPVGKDFPVFLHPSTHEEYALARTERKTGPGYKGFAFHADPSVTLLEDLARRDLTINAMAEDDQGLIIDPFGGQRDLSQRVLRHVGPAFAEDPVRILRVARFAARFTEFTIAPETLELMRQMVANGEVDALVPERIWQEISRGLMEARPARMFETLAACGALARIAPELSQPPDSLWRALDRSAAQGRVLAVRSAVWVGEGGLDAVQVETLGERLRMPSDCMELGILTVREGAAIAHLDAPDAKGLLDLIERCDALRRRERFDRLLEAIVDLTDRPLAGAAALLHRAVDAVRQVDAGKIAQAVARADIGSAVRQARLEAVAALLG